MNPASTAFVPSVTRPLSDLPAVRTAWQVTRCAPFALSHRPPTGYHCEAIGGARSGGYEWSGVAQTRRARDSSGGILLGDELGAPGAALDRMAQEDRNRLGEWLILLRKQIPILRHQFADWVETVKEEPILIWQTPAIRYTVYGLAVVVLLWGVAQVAGSLAPAPPPGAKQVATTADFHVVCSDRQCAEHFVIHRKFGFRKFPVTCPRCKKNTGRQARRCNSAICQGRWVAPARVERILQCPQCGGRFH